MAPAQNWFARIGLSIAALGPLCEREVVFSSTAAMDFMNIAIEEACNGVRIGNRPFGAVVVKDGKIVGQGHNTVLADNDPTAHAEVTAIRDACKNLNSFQLDGCQLYASCHPCPMCLGAALLSRVDAIYFAATTCSNLCPFIQQRPQATIAYSRVGQQID